MQRAQRRTGEHLHAIMSPASLLQERPVSVSFLLESFCVRRGHALGQEAFDQPQDHPNRDGAVG